MIIAMTKTDLERVPGVRPNTCLGRTLVIGFVPLSIFFGKVCKVQGLLRKGNCRKQNWFIYIKSLAASVLTLEKSGKTDLSSKTGAFLMVLTILIGLFCFILLVVGNKSSPSLLTWDLDSPSAKSLTWQAAFFFVTTWICFGVGEILLLAALSVESGHLKNWSKARTGCYSIREGLFSAAGVLALTTVFLAAGLYLTALRAQKMAEEEAIVRREVLETSALYASPPRSPQPQYMSTVARENPTSRENQNELLLSVFPTPFVKGYDFV
ncbi:uncharacterized protein HKW66_Vig0091240 [Vigna angularis]|uniref:Uncharacterized protein n=1 Tax=Phaseolus angularis TaxID=3914 RepID=A0A8T0KK94_PHAAN|nr:uncharacterized protein HKW66_Vig0091240 [Vigna angularis]